MLAATPDIRALVSIESSVVSVASTGGCRRRVPAARAKGGRMARRAVIAGLVGLVVLGALLVPGAIAGKPVLERFDVDETAPDPFLTAACGIAVTTHAEGHVIVRTLDG